MLLVVDLQKKNHRKRHKMNKFPTLQFLILNISAVKSAIKRIFHM